MLLNARYDTGEADRLLVREYEVAGVVALERTATGTTPPTET